MFSIGIDVSKWKSTVAILSQHGKIVQAPLEISHTQSALVYLAEMAGSLKGEVRIVMESTGAYHLPVLHFLKDRGFFVSVINPMVIQKYAAMNIRKVKTDSMDALMIARFGMDCWQRLTDFSPSDETYAELRLLSRQYLHYLAMLKAAKLNVTHLMDQVLPGIKPLLKSQTRSSGRNILGDFVEKFWHVDLITKMSEDRFVAAYATWAKKTGRHSNETKARGLYANALEAVPTLSSRTPSTKMLVLEAVYALQHAERTLAVILARMQEIAKNLKEYAIVRAMPGVGDTLAPRIIAELGDIRRFRSGSSLVAFAGIDAPPYQSGSIKMTNRSISKRGSSSLRRTGYEIMQCIKMNKPAQDDAVYRFMLKKEAEGKAKKVAKIAALNKFLRIYYARVSAVYSA
ncbi:MAG: IS110 family transposase [Clostridiales bacterium]